MRGQRGTSPIECEQIGDVLHYDCPCGKRHQARAYGLSHAEARLHVPACGPEFTEFCATWVWLVVPPSLTATAQP